MKNIKSITIYSLILSFLFVSCEKKNSKDLSSKHINIQIYDFSNKSDLSKFNSLNLDATHPNLLSPQISEADYDIILKSWTDLHQAMGNHLKENDFRWEVKDSNIGIMHKFYFESNGKIKSYFFRLLNEEVTDSKRKEYADLVVDFSNNYQMQLSRDSQYAQCGKTRYQ